MAVAPLRPEPRHCVAWQHGRAAAPAEAVGPHARPWESSAGPMTGDRGYLSWRGGKRGKRGRASFAEPPLTTTGIVPVEQEISFGMIPFIISPPIIELVCFDAFQSAFLKM